MVSFREDAIEDERAASPSVDGQFDGRDPAGDAGRHRRPIDCRAVRADTGRPPARAAARPAAGAGQRNRAQPPSRRHAAPQPDLGGMPVLSGRRLLAAPRSSRCRRDRRQDRVPHPRLGLAPVRPRSQPGVVRVQLPAWRAPRHGSGPAAGLFLGLCRRARHPHGLAANRPAPGAGAAPRRSRAIVGHRNLLRAARDAAPYRNCAGRERCETASWMLPTSSARSRRAPPPSISRTRPFSA